MGWALIPPPRDQGAAGFLRSARQGGRTRPFRPGLSWDERNKPASSRCPSTCQSSTNQMFFQRIFPSSASGRSSSLGAKPRGLLETPSLNRSM
jgi:hypothetical protein